MLTKYMDHLKDNHVSPNIKYESAITQTKQWNHLRMLEGT